MNTIGANTLYRTVLNTDGTNSFIQGFLCVREKVQGAADETPREISLPTPLTDISAAPVTPQCSVSSASRLACEFGTLNPAWSSITVS